MHFLLLDFRVAYFSDYNVVYLHCHILYTDWQFDKQGRHKDGKVFCKVKVNVVLYLNKHNY